MTGDGTNDAPALAQADVGVAMNTGTQAAREAGNMVDLDSNPTKLIEIVEIGKQLLITRGALTTFSVANDVAKYFAILPAMFAATYATGGAADGPLDRLNIMALGTPESAIISAIVFNALIIPLLVPLALRGVRYRRDRRDRPAAAQPADLRPRRPDRPVHRDQARGPGGPQSARGVDVRGHYKIFLGMAAGVGKTYRMLQEGRAEQAAGRDVVIGYLEPHARQETEAQAVGLERLPRRAVEHRGSAVDEMDLPAIFQRAPDLCLIDELAHTNAPGLEHVKRHEDIDDVLDAGIDVFSTVNVQHLESLNDRVAELTGVRVRETFPDQVLGSADEVVLVDLTPEALIARMRAGKVYPPERVSAALNHFFRDREPRRAARGGAAPDGRGGGVEARGAGRRAARHARGAARRRGPAGGGRAGARAGHAPRALAAAGAPRLALGSAPGRRARPPLRVPARQRRRAATSASSWRPCAGWPRCSAPSCWSRRATTWWTPPRAWPPSAAPPTC